MSDEPRRRPRIYVAHGIIPLVLAIALVAFVIELGPGLVSPNSVILPEITIEKIEFDKTQILASVRNTGHIDVRIAQADINDRVQPSAVEPDASLKRLESALVRIPYEWNIGEPYEVGITLDDGTRFTRGVEAAVPSLEANASTLLHFVFIGSLVGVIPVMIGMLWRPFISRLDQNWRTLVLGLAIGFLAFIAVDTTREALEISAEWGLDSGFNGTLLVVTAGALVFLALQYASTVLRRSGRSAPMIITTLVAGGIGLHNLGEGLAIGAAIGLGQAAFTSFLVIGLALHNMTEGFAITAPVARIRVRMVHLVGLGLLAGLPVIVGTVAGGLVFSPLIAVILLGAAAGAIAQVITSIVIWMRSENVSVSGAPVLAGASFGILMLYLVSILV